MKIDLHGRCLLIMCAISFTDWSTKFDFSKFQKIYIDLDFTLVDFDSEKFLWSLLVDTEIGREQFKCPRVLKLAYNVRYFRYSIWESVLYKNELVVQHLCSKYNLRIKNQNLKTISERFEVEVLTHSPENLAKKVVESLGLDIKVNGRKFGQGKINKSKFANKRNAIISDSEEDFKGVWGASFFI